jgi:hypothetical protein
VLDGPDNPIQVCGVEYRPPAGAGAQICICVFGEVVYSRTGDRYSDFQTVVAIANSIFPIAMSCLGFAAGTTFLAFY